LKKKQKEKRKEEETKLRDLKRQDVWKFINKKGGNIL